MNGAPDYFVTPLYQHY